MSSPKHVRVLSDGLHHDVPSPLPTRRVRTNSMSRMAAESQRRKGVCVSFDRHRGHGFIKVDEADGGEQLFVHVSDIETPFVLQPGDHVSFKTCLIPPKKEQLQAVHVVIADEDLSKPGRERWAEYDHTTHH